MMIAEGQAEIKVNNIYLLNKLEKCLKIERTYIRKVKIKSNPILFLSENSV